MWVTIEVWQKKNTGVSTVTSGLKETLHPVFVPWKARGGGGNPVCVCAWLCEKDQMAGWGKKEGGRRQDVGGPKRRGLDHGRGQGCAHLRTPGAWMVQLQPGISAEGKLNYTSFKKQILLLNSFKILCQKGTLYCMCIRGFFLLLFVQLAVSNNLDCISLMLAKYSRLFNFY